MPVNFFHSQMDDSPKLNGTTAGMGIAVLEKCLVTGFNTSTITGSTFDAQTATLKLSYSQSVKYTKYQRVKITGTNTDVDGVHQVIGIGDKEITISYAGSARPNSGSITVAPLGWTKVFHNITTHIAVFKSGNTQTPCFLHVKDDLKDTSGTYCYMTMHVYSNMSSITDGTNQMPPSNINDLKCRWWRSLSKSSSNFYWSIVGDSNRVYFGASGIADFNNVTLKDQKIWWGAAGSYKGNDGQTDGLFLTLLNKPSSSSQEQCIGSVISTIDDMYISSDTVYNGFLYSMMNSYPIAYGTMSAVQPVCMISGVGSVVESDFIRLFNVRVGTLINKTCVGYIPGIYHTPNNIPIVSGLLCEPTEMTVNGNRLLAVAVGSSARIDSAGEVKGCVFFDISQEEWFY